jgi:hypothetical protein
MTARTESNGHFEIENVQAGRCRVTVRPDARGGGFNYECEIPESGFLERDFDLPGGSLSGDVVSTEGTPVPDVKVTLDLPPSEANQSGGRRSQTTDDRGRFRFDWLPAGEHHLGADAPDGRMGALSGINVPPDGDTEPVTVVIGSGCALEVVVAIEGKGQPVEGAQVQAYRAFASSGPYLPFDGVTDSEGRCRFDGLPENEYSVYVPPSGCLRARESERVQATPQQTAAAKILMVECGIVDWRLLEKDGLSTQPQYIDVVSAPPEVPGFCSVHSRFHAPFTNLLLSPGNFVLKAVLKDNREILEPFEIQAGQTVRRETRLE